MGNGMDTTLQPLIFRLVLTTLGQEVRLQHAQIRAPARNLK